MSSFKTLECSPEVRKYDTETQSNEEQQGRGARGSAIAIPAIAGLRRCRRGACWRRNGGVRCCGRRGRCCGGTVGGSLSDLVVQCADGQIGHTSGQLGTVEDHGDRLFRLQASLLLLSGNGNQKDWIRRLFRGFVEGHPLLRQFAAAGYSASQANLIDQDAGRRQETNVALSNFSMSQERKQRPHQQQNARKTNEKKAAVCVRTQNEGGPWVQGEVGGGGGAGGGGCRLRSGERKTINKVQVSGGRRRRSGRVWGSMVRQMEATCKWVKRKGRAR